MSERYPLLFSKLRLGPLELRSRIVLSPMTTGFGFEEGVPDETLIAYFRARSAAVGMVAVAFGAVVPEGRVEEKLPWMWREDIGERLQPLVAALHDEGTRACLQLGHGGRQVSPVVTGMQPVAPSPVPPPVHVKEPPHELTIDEVEAVVTAFGTAAARAVEAGFDAIELHAGHGYLVHQFLSAASNLRTDAYGGDTITERARFGAEVVARIRREAPGLALVVRLNGDDITPGGMGPADALAAAQVLVAAGADAFVVSAGVYGSVPYTIPLLDDTEASHVEDCVLPEARAVGAGADGRRDRAAGRRGGGDPARRLRRGGRRTRADRRSGVGGQGRDGSHRPRSGRASASSTPAPECSPTATRSDVR